MCKNCTSSNTLAELIMNEEFDNMTGKYFDRSKNYIKFSELSYNENNRFELCDKSVEFTNLKKDESIE